jgi:uncharacterized protein (TIGR03437 family)
MCWAACSLAVLAASASLGADGARQAPTYSAASIVNAASNAVGELAPNTVAIIYGTNLSYDTAAASGNAVRELAGVQVTVGYVSAVLYYVSPGQVNLVIPNMLRGSEADLVLSLNAKAGPTVRIALREVAPALFQWEGNTVVATRPDWTPVNASAPARPGDYVILFATGLGETTPEAIWGQAPQAAAPLKRLSEFRVLLDGAPVDAGRNGSIAYAGVAPGFAGLYQINLKLPGSLGNDPEIRIALGSQISPAGLRLPVRAAAGAQPAAWTMR